MAVIKKFGNLQTLEASGGAATNGVFVAADDNDYDDSTGLYPLVEIRLTCTLGTTAATAGEVVNIYYLEKNMLGESGLNADTPSTTYKHKYVGCFVLNSGTSAQDMVTVIPAPSSGIATVYLENACATGDIDSGWSLKARPMTYVDG